MNTKVEFQKDETNKLKQVHAAKLMAKQRHVEESAARINILE